ncbi:hypothetical protein [Caenispirillum bisanense]|uniref:hypothetical protein n=1 Tax=Caenispirillum bisanense TaxID=414052 RepID=UPI0031DC97EA
MPIAYSDEPTRQFRDAMRLLFILAQAGEDVGKPPPVPGAVKVVVAQKKLQKLDFFVRNPDHLAEALLDRHQATGERQWLQEARSILDSEEPEIRRDAMAKYLFGAYEPIDTGMAPLVSYGLAECRRHPDTKVMRFFLLGRGAEVANTIAAEMEEARWYVARAALVGALCGGMSAQDIADMQYRQPEYANAPHGETISSIAARVRQRLKDLESVHG